MLTGCNEAFIITTEKRNEILGNCQTEEERERTGNIIRPIIRGRDIKKYSFDWAGLWLINTHNGIKGELERIHIEDYPALKAHLEQFKQKLEERSDKGDTPYNLRNCAYMQVFNEPKIVWKRVGSILRFGYNDNGALGLDSTCFATGKQIEYLCCVLNSPMGHYLLKDSPKTGTGDLLISVQAVEPIKVPMINEVEDARFKNLFKSQQEHEINRKVFELYNLSEVEITFIMDNYY